MSSDLTERLQTIYNDHGRLDPPLVVDLARDPNGPYLDLHHRFEWDDRIAGEAHRREQAHKLITSARLVYRPDEKPQESVRAFHAVPSEQGYAYHPAMKIAQDPFSTRLLMASMEREWRQLKKRYDQFAEFWELVNRDAAA